MSTTTIKSPDETFSGSSSYGATVLKFEDGIAKHDGDLPAGVLQYLQSAGYTIGRTTIEQPTVEEERVDARDVDEPEQVGTKLRDAAVDPDADDFLAPTNAGQADPHGPDVVSPEVHASQGVRPVKGGDVHIDDTDKQDAEETAHTEDATDGTPVVGVEEPSGNANAETWRAYAISQGASEDDVKGLGRNQLRDKYKG